MNQMYKAMESKQVIQPILFICAFHQSFYVARLDDLSIHDYKALISMHVKRHFVNDGVVYWDNTEPHGVTYANMFNYFTGNFFFDIEAHAQDLVMKQLWHLTPKLLELKLEAVNDISPLMVDKDMRLVLYNVASMY